jgi:anaerobic selenocysteine-containing dehydrogenase
MARTALQITRRNFLKSSLLGAAALSLGSGTLRPVAEALARAGSSLSWFRKGQIKLSYNTCDMCPWRCGIVVHSVNGQVYKVDGNPADPKSGGMLCGRGQAAPSFMYDPDRLRAPMIRTGERGEGKFKEVTWAEAFSTVAAKADYWLPLKPGTDTALLLAWLNVFITEELYDKSFVAEWTNGFDKLTAYVAELTPEWAAPITDLSPELIRETVRLMAANLPRSAIIPGRHVTWYGNDTQRMRAIYIVNALLGAYGREGGIYCSSITV